MGIFKKLFKPLVEDGEHLAFQTRAILKQEKIAKGEKVQAPKHPTDEANFRAAQKNLEIKKEIDRRQDDLIEKVNKMNIKSFDPPERTKSNGLLPTRESEFEHINDPKFQYGFYEPPLEKMQPGKLMLREAMELLYAKTEIDLEGPDSENARNVLQTHPATSRVNAEDIDDLYKYYRPFVRKDIQRVGSKYYLGVLSDYMNNRSPFDFHLQANRLGSSKGYFKSIVQQLNNKYNVLEGEEKSKVIEAIYKRKEGERKRLEQHLQDFADESQPKSEENTPTKK